MTILVSLRCSRLPPAELVAVEQGPHGDDDVDPRRKYQVHEEADKEPQFCYLRVREPCDDHEGVELHRPAVSVPASFSGRAANVVAGPGQRKENSRIETPIQT